MSLRNALILSTIFLLLGAYVYFVELKKSDARPSGPGRPVVVETSFDDMVDVEIHYRGEITAVRKDGEGKWRFREGERQGELVQTDRVTAIRFLLAGLRADRLIAEQPEDFAEFGLDKPEVEVTLGTKDGGKATILIGSRNPRQSWQYWKMKDADPVYLIVSEVGDVMARFVAEPPIPTPTAMP